MPRVFARRTDFLSRLREIMARLPRAERGVAQAILEDPDSMLSLSISELAERSGAGDATVVRLARRCGLSGYQELKILVAADRSDAECPAVLEASGSLAAEAERVLAANTASLAATQGLLDPDGVRLTAQRLDAARLVAICGVGTSALAAKYLAYRLTRMGVVASFEEDAHYQAMGTVLMDRAGVAIAFSQSGSTYSVVGALGMSRAAGAFTVAITRSRSAPLTAAADVIFLTGADETPLLSGALPGLVSQLYLADILAVATGGRRPDRAREALRLSAERVATMKF